MALSTYFQNSGAVPGTGAAVPVAIPANATSFVLYARTVGLSYAWSSSGSTNWLEAGSSLVIQNPNVGGGTLYLTQAAGANQVAYLTYELTRAA